ncbi:hypothetical protein GCM10027566_03380 [Arachidicoccus ginsenosidivorans]|uniref:Uncharacterized protein n=1 Tax=Arachidicoccus ginsenosidivorans TaxID=496057 RepID=A0A5B8VLV1_9BACT|nr:hypothetical protein [Arachidicoccus ginsenosidivorans]QEC72490.1 hypothetical protein FSB73_13210 [Arachidicoccus ginsenosidivorans]
MKHYKLTVLFSILLSFLVGCNSNSAIEGQLFNATASRDAEIGSTTIGAVLNWHMVTLLKDNKTKQILVLYANDQAFKAVKQGVVHYEAGAILALVHWLGKPDIHWFGADIPGEITSIDQVSFATDGKNSPKPNLTTFIKRKRGFEKVLTSDTLLVHKTTNFILSLRRPYLPD